MNELGTAFEIVVLNELAKAWHRNIRTFGWDKAGLSQPSLRITDAQLSYMGQWETATREMSFSRHLVTTRPWNEVIEVLKHEMAHQYLAETLKVFHETSHGPTFYQVCKQYHIDAAPRGTPGADKVTATNHIVEKIQHLLELAAKNPEPEEADAAAKAARNLMLKYNIEVQAKNEERGYTIRYLGGVTGRIQAYMSVLATILNKFYFVECIWMPAHDPRNGKEGNELEVSGTEDNVEAAEFIYDFLSRAALQAWETKFADPTFKLELDREFSRNYGRTGAPTTPRGFVVSARSNFLTGFMRGFQDKLKQNEAQEQQAGLILAKDAQLESFFNQRHPHIRHLHSPGAFHNSKVKNQGYADGSNVKIPLAAKANKQFIPLLNK